MESLLQRLDHLYLSLDRRLRGWPTLLIRTGLAFDQDDGAVMSRSIAYYALFSLFPLVLVLVSFLSGVLADEDALQTVIEFTERYIPAATELITANFEQMLTASGTVGILASIGLLWSASGVFTAIYRSVNRAWGNPKSKLFWSEKLYGIAVVVIAGLLIVIVAAYATIASLMAQCLPSLFAWQPLANLQSLPVWRWISPWLPALISVLAFGILYRTIPRNRVSWRDVWLGGVLGGLVWEAARRIYAWYLSSIASYNLIYGSVGAIIGFLLWSYLSAMILLIGAEFAAQHTAWRREGRPIESRPLRQWMGEWSKWENPSPW